MPRHTIPEREKIRAIIHEAHIIQALRIPQVMRLLAQNGFALKRRAVEYYVQKLNDELRAQGKVDRDHARGVARERLNKLFRTSVGDDKRLALAVQRELDVIDGLITHKMEHSGSMTFERWLRTVDDPSGAGPDGQGAGRAPSAEPFEGDHGELGGEPFLTGEEADASSGEGPPAAEPGENLGGGGGGGGALEGSGAGD